MERPETTYNKQETTWNDPQQVRHNLQLSELSNNEQKKARNRGNRFSSLTPFPSNNCFMENHGENRAPKICILSCVFITGYKIFRTRYELLWHSYIYICDAKTNLMNWAQKIKFWHRWNIQSFENDCSVVFIPWHWKTIKCRLYFAC